MKREIPDIALTLTPGIGPKGAVHLLDVFGSAEAVFSASADELIEKARLRPELARAILQKKAFADAEREVKHCRKHGIEIIASTEGCRHAAVQCLEKKLYGVQFHPEVVHTEYGRQILENFLYKICGFRPEWTMASYLEEAVAQCREKIGKAGCCWRCPAAWTAPWPPRCCSGRWAVS